MLLFLGPLATAFGYIAVIKVSKSLPAVTTSLSLLAVPILGLICSKVILGEVITTDMAVALGLLTVGVGCVILTKDSQEEKITDAAA